MQQASSALSSTATPSEIQAAPLSFGQEQWWLMHQMEPESAAHNVVFPVRMRGALNIGALENALDEVRRRHEVLRTTFGVVDGTPRQLIQPFQKQALEVVDLSDLPDDERIAHAQNLSDEDARRPFDLAHGPLLRNRLLRLASDDHIWLRVSHHIVLDGWSLDVLLRELAAFYAANIQDQTPVLAKPLQHAEYSKHQQELDATQLESHFAYWQENLRGELPALELPTDYPRPQLRTTRGARYFSHVSTEAASTLGALCRETAVTPFIVLLAFYAALLNKHTGQNEVVIGSALANRTRPETRDSMGFLASTLPLRMTFDGNPSLRELMARARKVLMGAFAHAEIPFTRLVEKIATRRDASRSSFFQTFLVSLPPIHLHPLRGLRHETWRAESAAALYDLLLEVTPREGSFELMWQYNTDLFEAPTIENIAARLGFLLETATRQLDAPLSQLEILPDAEHTALLQRAGGEKITFEYSTLHELVFAAAARTPQVIAAEDETGDARLSYQELSTRARQIARALEKQGVTRGERVALWASRRAEVLSALPAISFCGAACVPLDANLPSARLQQILQNAAPRALLISRADIEKISGLELGATRVLFLEDCLKENADPTSAPSTPVAPEDIVYVLYTSGSSGAPKGVALPQRALANLAQWQYAQSREYSGVAPRTLHFAPLGFDVAWQEIAATWSAGATLVLVQETTRRDPRALLEVLRARRIERLFLPFIALQQLAECAAKVEDESFPRDLKEIVGAGEALLVTPAIARFFERLQKYSPATLHNHYGPTETHVVTSCVLSGAPKSWPARAPLGKPIANARVFVLDENRRLAPSGVAGEIAIGGIPLARSYWNDEKMSDEKFVEIEMDGTRERVYLTGDVGRWNTRDALEFLGRRDEQIKVRGFRVETAEIETVLMEHPKIRSAAVVAEVVAESSDAATDSSHTRLIAYLVGDEIPTAQLRSWLLARLPEYMVPSSFIEVEALPRTASGKVARRDLPATTPHLATQTSTEFCAPRAGEEAQLAEVWRQVLGVERVGARDNFFDLGGHSLLATQVVARLRDEYGIELPLRAIFDTPTIEQLAPLLETSDAATDSATSGWDEGAL